MNHKELVEQVQRLTALCTVLTGLVVKGFGENVPSLLYRLQDNFKENSDGFSEEDTQLFEETFENLHFTYKEISKL